MNSYKPIGGYFELELISDKGFLHSGSILLNTGRNCFEYILKANKVSRVYMPKYTCDVMFEPLAKLDIPYVYYSIDEKLELVEDIVLEDGEFLVYTNYFGLKDNYTKMLSRKYGQQLIIDASQALYFEPAENSHTFYSPRKYVGITDGGCLYTNTTINEELEYDISYQRFSHLLKRIDLGAEAGYADFKHHDKSFENQPIKKMSLLTKKIMGTIDYENVKLRRRANFDYLQRHLEMAGELAQVKLADVACPMYFVYSSDDPSLRQKLIDNKIFVPTYWSNVLDNCVPDDTEYRLVNQLLPLPIDQRYNETDMKRIVEIISGS